LRLTRPDGAGALALLTSASDGDIGRARLALSGAARRTGPKAPPAIAPLCDALARLGRSCTGTR